MAEKFGGIFTYLGPFILSLWQFSGLKGSSTQSQYGNQSQGEQEKILFLRNCACLFGLAGVSLENCAKESFSPYTHHYSFCLTWNSTRADWPRGRHLSKHWKTKNKPLLPGARVTVWETIDTEKIQVENLRGDFWGEHIFVRFPHILGNLERHMYTQGRHMLRKIQRKSYDFIMVELYAKCKPEVKAKAELKNGVTKEGVTQ